MLNFSIASVLCLSLATLIACDISCDDPQYQCPDDTTCCMMKDGTWGCCPMPNAVCCSDKEHCCPEDTICDLKRLTCNQTDGTAIRMSFNIASKRQQPTDTTCDDQKTECPSGTTCCSLGQGRYGCCPFLNAVCCPDNLHCCPENTTCDEAGYCHRNSASGRAMVRVPWTRKIPAKIRNSNVQEIACDTQTTCPDDTTCCMMKDGSWGCCLMPEAVCCSDNEHCCPKDTVCDVEHLTCRKADGTRFNTSLKIVASKRQQLTDTPVICDEKTQCPSGYTCCPWPGHRWGCCHLENAVCCDDNVHCCPENTICNVEAGTCDSKSATGSGGQRVVSLPWARKIEAMTRNSNVQSISCDQKTTCPDGTTCCKLKSGKWGCCPMPNAVCCSDGEHCCPQNTVCDVQQGKCIQNDVVRGDSRFMSLIGVADVKCDDQGPAFCPDGSTCCKTPEGEWRCCTMERAVCCEDGLHCCPENTQCDMQQQTCIQWSRDVRIYQKLIMKPNSLAFIRNTLKIQTQKLPSFLLMNPTKLLEPAKMVTCPNGIAQCIADMSCCPTDEGFGCCPFINGQCCPNKQFCCPSGSTCNGTTCQAKIGGTKSITFDASKLITIVEQGSTQEVQCKDGVHSCPQNSKCCKTLFRGQYGCCPDPEGVCCSDGTNCCPKGYVCKKNGQCKAV